MGILVSVHRDPVDVHVGVGVGIGVAESLINESMEF